MAAEVLFSGYAWTIKTGVGGPRENHFEAENVRVGRDGLSLRVASEIFLSASLGFGKYRFVLQCDASSLCANTIVGLFLYADDHREIDIELENTGATYTIQDFRSEFVHGAHSGVHRYTIVWTPHVVEFYCDGECVKAFETPTFRPGDERVHINVWTKHPVTKNPPVMIREFKYTPLSAPSFSITIADQYKYHWGMTVGLSVAGPNQQFPLLVGSSLRTPQGEIRDLPVQWLTSAGLGLWHFNVGPEFRTDARDEFSGVQGQIRFKLWRDDSFAECLSDTGWVPWTAPWLRGGSTAGLDMQEEQMRDKYKGRQDVWTQSKR